MTDTTDNPFPHSLGAGEEDDFQIAADPPEHGQTEVAGKRDLSRAELEAALRGLKDGSLTEQDAAAVVERLIDARVSRVDSRVDRLRAELTTPAEAKTILGPLVQSVFAHMTEAPTNVGLTTAFLAAF
eukprot:SAG31_NODE_4005_length_3672_cov_2.293031_3_plen_128_part_00